MPSTDETVPANRLPQETATGSRVTEYTVTANGKTNLKIGDPIPADADLNGTFKLDDRSTVTSTLRTVTFDLNGGNGQDRPGPSQG